MPKISAVLIVKNEETLLSRCLDSIKGVDEIIIVDTGSTDKTIEVAKKYTDKVFNDYTWNDHFAEARNHALRKATGDWVLSIDADEFVEDFSKIMPAIIEAEQKGILVIDCKLYAEGSRQMHLFPRLFKRDPRVWWEGAVHNHISVRGQSIGDVRITYGFSPAHLLDPNRAFRILQKECEKPDHSPRQVFYLGREYWYRRDFNKCIEVMSRYVNTSTNQAERADAFVIMARCLRAVDRWDEARTACVNAIICNAHFKEAILLMALLAGEGTGNAVWEANAEQWKKMAETADNRNVLFVRAE